MPQGPGEGHPETLGLLFDSAKLVGLGNENTVKLGGFEGIFQMMS